MARRALIVGINEYSVPKYNLRGCVPDAKSLQRLLQSCYQFADTDIRLLLDADATGARIRDELRMLVANSAPGDVLVFGFSGHGSQKGFQVPDEDDQKDECLVPHDISYESLITDNELFDIITSGVQDVSTSFTAIYDCCHSGSLVREIGFDDNGELTEIVINRVLDIDWDTAVQRPVQIGPYNVFSACKDEETAADLLNAEGNGPRGAFSFALHQAVEAGPKQRIKDLEAPVLERIQALSAHVQAPQYVAVSPDAPLFTAL